MLGQRMGLENQEIIYVITQLELKLVGGDELLRSALMET